MDLVKGERIYSGGRRRETGREKWRTRRETGGGDKRGGRGEAKRQGGTDR